MISTISLTLNLDTKIGRVTDTTDYSGLVASLGLYQGKGLGTISFQGNIIESKTTTGDPLIDLAVGDTFFEFPLELDVNGEVANGIYEVDYSLRLSDFALSPTIVAITLPSEIEVVMPEMISNFLEVGNEIILANLGGTQTVTIASINYVDPTQSFITFNEVIDDPTYNLWYFDLINLQVEGVYTYSGCVRAEGKISFSYDCDVAPNGTFGVSNATVLTPGQVVQSVAATINYPSWTASQVGFIPQIPNAPLPYTNNVLATGTYSVVMNQIISQIQNDGLIINYSANAINEFVVTCVGSLCGLNSCIENLRRAHVAELSRNRISKYQPFVDSILMYYTEAQTYRSCGEIDAYGAALANIQLQLDASGCDCGCCDEDSYRWISINSSATIESLIEAIQYRLYTPAVSGPPLATDDEAAGVQVGAIWQDTTTGILYRCTSNVENNAVWVPYYDPSSIIVAALGVTSNAQIGGIILGTNVQTNIDSINVALINNDLSITNLTNDVTDLGIEVSGLVESVTGGFVDNTDPNNPVVNDPSSSQVTYSATIDGSTITTVFGALEKLRVSESNYQNSLLYYSGIGNVTNTLNRSITGKIACRISDGAAVSLLSQNMYDPALSAPTLTLQLDQTYILAFPASVITLFSTVLVSPNVKEDGITVKAQRESASTVKVMFVNAAGAKTTTATNCNLVIEVYR